jgi:two-component system sensor histidine kinase KdpD
VAATLCSTFEQTWVAVLLPDGDALQIAATAGAELSNADRDRVTPLAGQLESLVRTVGGPGITRVALTAMGRPVGQIALFGPRLPTDQLERVRAYANQAALALERSVLAEKARRAELLEEVDLWRDALMGAVSHDLRTPLASVKTAVSTLRDGRGLSADDRAELLELIEVQSDNLARLVTNLLDMTRIQSGSLELRREVGPVLDIVEGALQAVAQSGQDRPLELHLPDDLPLVDIDQTLMVQVLVNLLENALRHSPEGATVVVEADDGGSAVHVAVRDSGPGVPAPERERVFLMFNTVSGSGRAGLGLTIAKSFVEAHGGSIWVEDASGGGARFVFTMPKAILPADAA